jgi:hypothetical protein
MSVWSQLLAAFGAQPISSQEVRAEAYFLGGRHKGEVAAGARAELRAANLSPRRAALLRAVLRSGV